jgi:hypothetical protein
VSEDDKIRVSRKTVKKLADQSRLPETITDREKAELLEKVAKKLREDQG